MDVVESFEGVTFMAVTSWSLFIVGVMFLLHIVDYINAKLTVHYLNMCMDDSVSVDDMLFFENEFE